jgi:NADPH:quinone reductase-like Zn-dependent oxidoreductase
MEQIWITRHGGPEVLQVRSSQLADPDSGEVQVQVAYAGINFADLLARMGLYPSAPKPPFIPGYEVSGVVVQVGAGVDQSLVGKPVLGVPTFGGYTSRINLPVDRIVVLERLDDLQAGAAIPVNYLSAYLMLIRQARLQPREWILIHGIGGGVGLAALQISQIIGVRVIGTASGGKHDRLKAMGVQYLIDYRREDFVAQVREITGGQGADVILDPIGGAHLKRSYSALAKLGRLVIFGFSAAVTGPRRRWGSTIYRYFQFPRFHPVRLMMENKGIFGFHLGMLKEREEVVQDALTQLIQWYQQGKVRPVIDKVFPFSQVREAHQYIADRNNLGKVLLQPDGV